MCGPTFVVRFSLLFGLKLWFSVPSRCQCLAFWETWNTVECCFTQALCANVWFHSQKVQCVLICGVNFLKHFFFFVFAKFVFENHLFQCKVYSRKNTLKWQHTVGGKTMRIETVVLISFFVFWLVLRMFVKWSVGRGWCCGLFQWEQEKIWNICYILLTNFVVQFLPVGLAQSKRDAFKACFQIMECWFWSIKFPGVAVFSECLLKRKKIGETSVLKQCHFVAFPNLSSHFFVSTNLGSVVGK